jgi:UDP-glucose 4-epimerase
MAILVTGGAGYIGSHTCVELLQAGYELVVVDNLCNSRVEALRRVQQLSGKEFPFYETDLRDKEKIEAVFANHPIEAVVHFAGLKAVGESVQEPLRYYDNNVGGTVTLCEAMRKHGVHRIVFSSSATVYGTAGRLPLSEEAPLGVTNPYGRTKLMLEQMLQDLYVSDSRWGIALLRYFNPVGAHESGRIGEDPSGIPNNLMPYITQVAAGRLQELRVFGSDYPTIDGTGVRDYIHVVDLARGHVKALQKVLAVPGIEAYNLGTGKGCSVLQLVAAFERASGIRIPYTIAARRPGDVAASFADPAKAWRELGWKAGKSIADMCRDAWRWQAANPNGYAETDR